MHCCLRAAFATAPEAVGIAFTARLLLVVDGCRSSGTPPMSQDRDMTLSSNVKTDILDLRREDGAVVLLTYRGDW